MNAELRALSEADQQDRWGKLSLQIAERDRGRWISRGLLRRRQLPNNRSLVRPATP